MATDNSPQSESEKQQTTIDGFLNRTEDAASRTQIDDGQILDGEDVFRSDGASAPRTGGPPASGLNSLVPDGPVPESPDDVPDPDSDAVQAAAVAGRAAIAPLLVDMGNIDEMTIPSGQYHDVAEDIAASLRTVARRGHSVATVFDDWLDLLLYALAAGDYEAEYQQTAQRYAFNGYDRGERGIDHLGTATGQLFTGVLQTGADLLGDVYHILGRNSDRLGQFFTPHTVATTKVEVAGIVDDTSSAHGRGDTSPEAIDSRVGIHDPACGSARLLVPAARASPDAWFSGVDLDSTCAKMAALNLLFCNVDGQIHHGNSLTMEMYRAYEVRYTGSGGILSIREIQE